MNCPNCGAPAAEGSRFCMYCGKELSGQSIPPSESVPSYPPAGYVPPPQWVQPSPPLTSEQKLVKYFIHGIAFSFLSLILFVVGAFLILGLALIGLCIGVIIGLVIILFLYGYLNVFLTEAIWHVKIKRDYLSVFVHGLVLVVAMIIVGIPSTLINSYAPNIVLTIVLFIIYCFMDGFVARNIAKYWEIPIPQYPGQYPAPYQPY